MLKTDQFKTHCKGDSHGSKTANIILPGLMIKHRWTPLRPHIQKYSRRALYDLPKLGMVVELVLAIIKGANHFSI